MVILPVGGFTIALILVGFFGVAIFSSGILIPVLFIILLYFIVGIILQCLGIVSPFLPYIFSELVIAFFIFSAFSEKWISAWANEKPKTIKQKIEVRSFYLTITSFYWGISLLIAETTVGLFNHFMKNYDAPREVIPLEFFEVYACLWLVLFVFSAVVFIRFLRSS